VTGKPSDLDPEGEWWKIDSVQPTDFLVGAGVALRLAE
jgi:hypothetical protein